MSQLIVRNIEKKLVLALKRRAAEHGRSAEAEHRKILEEVLLAGAARRPSFKRFLTAMPHVGDDDDFAAPRDHPRDEGL